MCNQQSFLRWVCFNTHDQLTHRFPPEERSVSLDLYRKVQAATARPRDRATAARNEQGEAAGSTGKG